MKTLFISNDPQIFDSRSEVRARMRAYAEAVGELHILSRGTADAYLQKEKTLTLYPVKGPKLFSLLTMAARARRIIKDNGIEVVSAQDPFEYGLIALRAIRGTSAKLHVQVHTDFLSEWFIKSDGFRAPKGSVPFLNSLRIRIADYVLPRAEGIRVVSERIKKSLVARYPKQEPLVEVIPVAVSNDSVATVPLPPHSFSFTLVTVSRLESEKRIQDILYAIARIQQVYPSVGIFIIGEGRERKRLQILASKLGLTDKALFLGARADARGLMKSAHAYIQASAYEGYGRTLLEAALARIPIITTDVGIVGEVFMGYEDVLSAPVADPAQLAVHISGLVEDHQARISLAINAEVKAKAHITSLSEQSKRIAENLEKTLKRA